MPIKDNILDLLFPPKCVFCGKLMTHTGSGVCPACEKALPLRPEEKMLQRAGQFDCAVPFWYEEPVRTGLHAMKFDDKPARARVFARYLAQTAAEQLSGRFDAVTFVPLSAWRSYRRGYNQAQQLARETARLWGVKAEKTLVKIGNNPPQSSVKTPAERRANVLGRYRAAGGADIAGRRFLLIDDIVTSGSTLAECAGTLLQAGAASVVCAAVAGGHDGEDGDPR